MVVWLIKLFTYCKTIDLLAFRGLSRRPNNPYSYTLVSLPLSLSCKAFWDLVWICGLFIVWARDLGLGLDNFRMWGAPLSCLFRIILLYVVCGSQLWGRRVSATITHNFSDYMVKSWRVNFMYSFNRFGVTKINQDNLLWVEDYVCTDVITNSRVFSGMFMCFRKWCGALYAQKLNKLWYSPIIYDMKTQIFKPSLDKY